MVARRRLCLGVLVLLCLLGAGCGRAAARPPGRQPGQALAPLPTVAAGVTVAGQALGGMSAADATRVLEGLAAEVDRPPRNAYLDPITRGLVPAVAGARLDVGQTLREVLSARPGTEVAPVTQALPPSVGVADLPPAPIYNGSPTRPEVAFVINVAWGEGHLRPMLAALTAAKAPATWCLVGRWAETHPAQVEEIVAAGRRAGTPYAFCNHGYRDHGWALLSKAQALQSIQAGDRAIAALTGAAPRYFSPHKGEYNPGVLAAARQAGHELVLWSLDTIDWKNPPAAALERRIVGRAKAGDIVLMHPTAPTAEALPAMIAGVRAKGLKLVTLDALLASERGAAGSGGAQG